MGWNHPNFQPICFFLYLFYLPEKIPSQLSCSRNSSLAVFNFPHEFFPQQIDGVFNIFQKETTHH